MMKGFQSLLALIYSDSFRHDLILYIYLGLPDRSDLPDIRSRIPSSSVLIHLAPPVVPEMAGPEISVPALTLSAILDRELSVVPDLQLVITCLRIREIRYAADSRVEHEWSSEYGRIRRVCEESLKQLFHEKMTRLLNFRTSLFNLSRIIGGNARRLPRLGPDHAAIVCAAGPSLASQFEQLRHLQQRAWIIAVGRTVPTLVANGIFPDFAVEIDASADLNWSMSDCPSSGCTLIALTHVAPGVAERFSAIVWSKGESVYFNRFLQASGIDLPQLRFSGTVTVTALDFAIRAGITRLALVGSDLCLDAANESHLGGEIRIRAGSDEIVEIPGNVSAQVKSVPSLVLIREALEHYLSEIAREKILDDIVLVNGTAGGAAVRGLPYLALEEFASLHIRSDVAKTRPELVSVESRDPALVMETLARGFRSCFRQVETADSDLRIQPLNRLLDDYSDEILFETPPPGPLPDPHRVRTQKLRLKQDMAEDFLADLDKLRCRRPMANPRQYEAFRKYAVAFVRQVNPGLAEFLASDMPFSSVPGLRFEISPCSGRFPPVVDAVRVDGTRVEITGGNTSMDLKVRREVQAFIDEHDLVRKPRPVLFAGTGNWQHLTAYSFCLPNSEMLILEPCPDLFRQLVGFSLFLHQIPESVQLLAACPQTPDWKENARDILAVWKKTHPDIPVFRHPGIWRLPEVEHLLNSVLL